MAAVDVTGSFAITAATAVDVTGTFTITNPSAGTATKDVTGTFTLQGRPRAMIRSGSTLVEGQAALRVGNTIVLMSPHVP